MAASRNNLELTEAFRRAYPGGHSNLSEPKGAGARPQVFVDRAKGSRLWDVEGKEYVEFGGALGPTLLGSCDEDYTASLKDCLDRLPTIGGAGLAYSPEDVAVAQKLRKYIPCAEQFKFCVTGNEAVQMAFRIARAYTGKWKVVRFIEHYHGWSDNVLGGAVKPGSDGEPIAYDDPEDEHFSLGMLPDAKKDMILLPWNDFNALHSAFEKHGAEIAIVHFEAMVNNCYGLYPKPGFLELIRKLCGKHNVVMCMDEVITGIRLGLGGAQRYFGITPDLCTMGKALAGGLPVSLVAGREEIMTGCFADRKVLGPGTFNGWILGMRAVSATLEILEKNGGARYQHMLQMQEALISGILLLAVKHNLTLRITEAPGVFHTIFGAKGGRAPAYSTSDLQGLDRDFMRRLRAALLGEGLMLQPSFRWYMSLAHTGEDIQFALDKMDKALGDLKSKLG
jgi:glutamate-1-semialdehyde 2,1-aminomutase